MAYRRLAILFALGILGCFQVRTSATPVWDESFEVVFRRAVGISRLAVQSDGRVVIIGEFTEVEGVPRNGIARLNVDGSVDVTFNAGNVFSDFTLLLVASQPDGKVLVGGLTSWRFIIKRLNSDGSLDLSFDFGSGIEPSGYSGEQAYDMLLLPNGQVLVGGHFNIVRGRSLNCLALFNSDGSLDPNFSANGSFGVFDTVTHLYLRDDGDVFFTSVASGGIISTFGFGRLNNDGSIDATVSLVAGGPVRVDTLTFASRGRLILFGEFYGLPGYAVRFNPDNTIDQAFSLPLSFWPAITKPLSGGRTLLINIGDPIMVLDGNGELDLGFRDTGVISGPDAGVEPDGRIIATGAGPALGSGEVNFGLVRVLKDGGVDTSFTMPGGTTAACGGFQGLAMQRDGKVLLRSDDDASANGHEIKGPLTRFSKNGSVDPTFAYSGPPLFGETPLAVQSDGKLLLGDFDHVFRVTGAGQPDPNFNCQIPFETVSKIVEFPKRRIRELSRSPQLHLAPANGAAGILIKSEPSRWNGGSIFDGGVTTIRKARSDGSIDPTFTPVTATLSQGNWESPEVRYILPWAATGMTYLAGHFSSLGGIGRTNLARISPNGFVDRHFQPQTPYPVVGAGLLSWGDLALLLEDGSVSVIRPSGLVRSRAMLQGGMPSGLRAVWLAPDFTFVLGSFPTGASPFLLQRFSLLGVLMGSCKVAVKPDQLRVIMQPDGSLIMAGSFPETGAADWSGMRRLSFKSLETISAH